MFPLEAQAKADELLGDGKFAPGYKRPYWDGCTHGFAVRGDMVSVPVKCRRLRTELTRIFQQSDPKVKAGKEGAFKENVEWLITYL